MLTARAGLRTMSQPFAAVLRTADPLFMSTLTLKLQQSKFKLQTGTYCVRCRLHLP